MFVAIPRRLRLFPIPDSPFPIPQRMSQRKYFGTDGIRGRVGQGAISADFVMRLGNALGRVL
ncbi:hypothetical protein FK492_24465, partial [Pantoea dispersa]